MTATTHTDNTHYTASGASHIAPPRVYITTWLILLGLMAMTVAASRWDCGMANNIIAMAIATLKASLVVMFFMQVRGSSKLTIIWAALGFLWLPFLFSTIADYLSRGWVPQGGWK